MTILVFASKHFKEFQKNWDYRAMATTEMEGFCIRGPESVLRDPRQSILVKEVIDTMPVVGFVTSGCLLVQDDRVNCDTESLTENIHLVPNGFKIGSIKEIILNLNSDKCPKCRFGGAREGNTTECPIYSPSVPLPSNGR